MQSALYFAFAQVEQTVASADGQPSVSNQKESGKDSPDNEKLNQLRSSGYRGMIKHKSGKMILNRSIWEIDLFS